MRILLPYPRSEPWGGAECLAAWGLQALRGRHELTVLAWRPLEIEQLNRQYGTSLRRADVVHAVPAGRRFVGAVKAAGADPHDIQSLALLMRAAKRRRRDHDLVVSLFDEFDLGGHGLQYVHEPWTYKTAGWRPWRALAGYSADRMRSNTTLVNSRFTADAVERELGARARVLHPPVPGTPRPLPWSEREDGVVTVARLVPGKRLETAIEVVAALRRERPGLRLHIAGRPDPGQPGYLAGLRRRAARAGGWITIHEDLARDELLTLLGRQRYGIHTMPGEPYGIAVAEMVLAGCLTLAPRHGGTAEILGDDERLLFENDGGAAAKLGRLLASEQLRSDVRAQLDTQARGLGTESFVRGLRQAVEELGS